MKTMKSDVCKRANELTKTGYYTKSMAFKKAWAEVKYIARSVKVSDINSGAALRVEYGQKGNFVTCTVTDICKTDFGGKYWVITAKATEGSLKGYPIEFTAKPEERIEKAA